MPWLPSRLGPADPRRPGRPTSTAWGPRSVELALLLVALAVVGLALFGLQVSGAGVVQTTSMRTWIGLVGLALVMHLVLRRVAKAADPLLLPIVVLLNGLGLVMIERLAAVDVQDDVEVVVDAAERSWRTSPRSLLTSGVNWGSASGPSPGLPQQPSSRGEPAVGLWWPGPTCTSATTSLRSRMSSHRRGSEEAVPRLPWS